MKHTLMLAAVLLSAACSRPDPSPAAIDETANATEASAENAVPLLEGQWQVASLDGRPVGSASAMTAAFKGGKATLSSGCLRRAWTYTQNKNVVTFAVDPGGSANCGGTSGEQETAFAALTEANIAIFNKEGSEASLSGTAGNLTLRRR